VPLKTIEKKEFFYYYYFELDLSQGGNEKVPSRIPSLILPLHVMYIGECRPFIH
jgi:hypothetical protein